MLTCFPNNDALEKVHSYLGCLILCLVEEGKKKAFHFINLFYYWKRNDERIIITNGWVMNYVLFSKI